MAYLLVCRGLPASGKTTWAIQQLEYEKDTVRVNRDDIRHELGITKSTASEKWNPKLEKKVRKLRDERITAALKAGVDVISDDTNLSNHTIRSLEDLASRAGAKFRVNDSFLEVPFEVCLERDNNRSPHVGKDVIERMYYDYWRQVLKPINVGKPAIICDLDGTLALIPQGSNRHDRDFTKDILNKPVAFILSSILESYGNWYIILMSGRDTRAKEQTEQWLATNLVCYDSLFMREYGDKRKDYIVKKELFMQNVAGQYKVEFVIDDRPSVVRMWRAELGLTCLQVGPNYEF